MKKISFIMLGLCLLTTSCNKINKNDNQTEIIKNDNQTETIKTEIIQPEIEQTESPVSLYKHVLDIGDDIQIMSDSNNQVLITKFSENKQIVIICDADDKRYMSQQHCEESNIRLFVRRCKVYDKQVEWVGVLERGANRYASKIVEEYDEYYEKTFTRVYTTYDSLYGWLNE